MEEVKVLNKPERKYLPKDFIVRNWDELKSWYEDLKSRNIFSVTDLEKWLKDRSELEAVVSEDLGWKYIRMTCDTTNKENEKAYLDFVSNIEPHIAPYENDLNHKLLNSPFLKDLDEEKYFIYLRSIKKAIEIFREENIPLFVEIQTEQQKFASISGAMTIEYKGQELTLQQAANLLKDPDRSVREEVFRKVSARRLQDHQQLDELFNKLLKLRHEVAVNAGFANFRDYMFAALGRFDYTPEDCFKFHEAIAKEVVPLSRELNLHRQKMLKLEKLRPWDTEVDLSGRKAPVPFADGKDLLNKTVKCFQKLHPYFSYCISTMDAMKHLDLESRKGKAPGGYNYPLSEIGVPFIFMNAASSTRDVETMVHEGGHAIHSFLTKDLELSSFKSCPSEVAELASMSMELISMDGWDEFYSGEELTNARIEQLEGIIKILPWIATVDKFQHWIYTHPEQTIEDRKKAWNEISDEFSTHTVDWSGFEEILDYTWQKQLHIFEVPFYYIEYGMAQLGAIAVWKNYKQDKQKGIENYMNALKLGYTKSIGDIYKAGGVKFDFSASYVKELMIFLSSELKKFQSESESKLN